MRRRVVITGAGVICSLGSSLEEFWRNALAGNTRVEPIPARWRQFADYRSTLWSPLPDLDFTDRGISRVQRMHFDPFSLMAICAAREAIENAQLLLECKDKRAQTFVIRGIDTERAGVFMGTGVGGAYSFLQNHYNSILTRHRGALAALLEDVDLADRHKQVVESAVQGMYLLPRVNPFIVSMLMPNAVSAALGLTFSLHGPNTTYCVACASSTVSVGRAYRAIREGEVDLALTGGSEYLDDYYGYIFRGFDVSGTLVQDCQVPESANRPFDKRRSGFLFGQGGAAVLVLEELEAATKRGAAIVAEVVGFAESFDAYSMMAMEPDGVRIERMLQRALADANLSAADVDYVNAHGTGTEANDRIEAGVLARVFGDKVLINSTKSLVGHTFGASGALEAVVTAMGLKHGTTHASRNLDEPIAPLNFARSVENHDLRVGLSESFAFGGHNAAVVMRRVGE